MNENTEVTNIQLPITKREFNAIMPLSLSARWFEEIAVFDNGKHVSVTWTNAPIANAIRPLVVLVKTIAAPFVFIPAVFNGRVQEFLDEYRDLYMNASKKSFTRNLSSVDANMIRNYLAVKLDV